MISYRQIYSERQWKAATGLSQLQFEKLVNYFGETYEFFPGYTLERQGVMPKRNFTNIEMVNVNASGRDGAPDYL